MLELQPASLLPHQKLAKPEWLKIRAPTSSQYSMLRQLTQAKKLKTVCEEAHCPNMAECWSGGTATFMILGDTCTRGCRYCAIKTSSRPPPPDANEPQNLVDAIRQMNLEYVVLTMVNRDDMPDQGVQHIVDCIGLIRKELPNVFVEMLLGDLQGNAELLKRVLETNLHVLAHNVETVPRLTARVRDRRANFEQSLRVLANSKKIAPHIYTKSAIMVGLGETQDEVIESMRQLRAVDCNMLNIGQYLQPTRRHLAIEQYVPPQTFALYEKIGLEMGFMYVASGPFVRSSYKAGELFMKDVLKRSMASKRLEEN